MSRESALAFANYLATEKPLEENYPDWDAYVAEVFGPWPDLTDIEIDWAVTRALEIAGHEELGLWQEADELRRYHARPQP
jgi:hypothetical protein